MEMQVEIRIKKCGISNQPDVCIFDDPCLSKFGTLQWGMSAPRETIRRTFVQHLPAPNNGWHKSAILMLQ